MASDYYTPPAQNVDGETADAADVNNVNNATLAAFELLELDINLDASDAEAWALLAQAWAENPEDSVISGQPAGSYSSYHWAQKAQASATSVSGDADAAAISAALAQASATSAASSASSAADSASDSEYWAGISEGGGEDYTFENSDLTAGVATITHTTGTQWPNVTVYNNSNKVISPDSIEGTSATELEIDVSSRGTITGTYKVRVS